LRTKEAAMLDEQRQRYDVDEEAAPAVASDAEIEMAEKLRHRLEERYLGPAAASPPVQLPERRQR
jgi:hypothetical protein